MKKILKVFFSVLVCVSMIIGMQSVSVQAATGNYKSWKQSDSRWANKKVGNNGTMKSWGCKITSIAILMVHSGVEKESNFNPGILRDRYESKGFISHSNNISNDGNLSSAAVNQTNSPNFYAVGTVDFRPTPFSQIRSKISNLLSNGYYVEVRVNNNQHSVAVDYCSSNEVFIMDPGYNKTKLSQWDGTIYSAIYYKAKKGAITPVKDNIKTSGCNYPTTLKKGKAYSIKGSVISEYSKITSLTVGVYNKSGVAMTSKTVIPNSKTYNIANVDKYIEFNKLPVGDYSYKIIAKNAKGTKTILNKPFKVIK